MQSYLNASLKNVHTFSIEQTCDVLVEVTSVDELISVYQDPQWSTLPKLVLGKGVICSLLSTFRKRSLLID